MRAGCSRWRPVRDRTALARFRPPGPSRATSSASASTAILRRSVPRCRATSTRPWANVPTSRQISGSPARSTSNQWLGVSAGPPSAAPRAGGRHSHAGGRRSRRGACTAGARRSAARGDRQGDRPRGAARLRCHAEPRDQRHRHRLAQGDLRRHAGQPANGLFKIAKLTGQFYGGAVDFSGTIDAGKDALALGLKGSLQGIYLSEMLRGTAGTNNSATST